MSRRSLASGFMFSLELDIIVDASAGTTGTFEVQLEADVSKRSGQVLVNSNRVVVTPAQLQHVTSAALTRDFPQDCYSSGQ